MDDPSILPFAWHSGDLTLSTKRRDWGDLSREKQVGICSPPGQNNLFGCNCEETDNICQTEISNRSVFAETPDSARYSEWSNCHWVGGPNYCGA